MNTTTLPIGRRGGSARLVLACAVVGLVAGVGVYIVPRQFDHGGTSHSLRLDAQHSIATFPAGIGRPDHEPVRFTPPPRPTIVVPTPFAAVQHFLDARVARRDADAWDVVSDRDRRQFPDFVAWEDANGELPTVTGYSLGPPQVIGDRGQLTGTVSFAPMLDEIAGSVPATVDATFVVVRERSNWHVSLSESEMQPRYPADAAAVPVARAWVAARQECHAGLQWNGPFLGDAESDAQRLCRVRGAVRADGVRELDDTDAAESFLAAFGSDVFSWARVVPVTAPARLDVVLAPLGDHWVVLGAIEASPAGP